MFTKNFSVLESLFRGAGKGEAGLRIDERGGMRHFQPMESNYTAITKRDGEWWIGWIEEIPGVNAQERTKEDLLVSLREVLKEALEFNRQEARSSALGNYTEELVTI